LLTDHDRRRMLAKAGRSKVLSNYDLSTNINHFIGVFEQYGLVGNASL
jgi:hypothetical protein